MKKTNHPDNFNPNGNEMISNLYKACLGAGLQLTKDKSEIEPPLVEESNGLVPCFDTHGGDFKVFNPKSDNLTIEAYGVYVPMDNINIHRPLVILFAKNIEACAVQYMQSKYGLIDDDPKFDVYLDRTVCDMKSTAKLYFTAMWILEHAEVKSGECFGVPEKGKFVNAEFKKMVALWMTSLAAQKNEGMAQILRDIIGRHEYYQTILTILQDEDNATFQALKQCIVWNTYSVELLIVLCKEFKEKKETSQKVNVFEFWWNLSVLVYAKPHFSDLANEMKRIVQTYYPKLINRLPFLFVGSRPDLWN